MKKSKLGTKEFKILGLSSLGGTLEFYQFPSKKTLASISER
ncbi:hypothetical protein B6683_001945 [Campylobacter coli]